MNRHSLVRRCSLSSVPAIRGAIVMASRPSLLLAVLMAGCVEDWKSEDADGDGVSIAAGDCWDAIDGPPGSTLGGADIFPGAIDEPYDGIDADCAKNDDYDIDNDGWVTDEAFVGLSTLGVPGSGSGHVGSGDCYDIPDEMPAPANDLDAVEASAAYPGAPDSWYDGIDQNCAGDNDFDKDLDGDSAQAFSDGTDCDDENPARSGLLLEVCDAEGIDEDCDELVNSEDPSVDPASVFAYYADADGDGFGDAATSEQGCDLPPDHVENADDCDDSRADVNPDADEVCDAANVDENCNGTADDEDATVVFGPTNVAWVDADSDGYGDALAQVSTCDLYAGVIDNADDCDDANADIRPGATEICDGGIDNDCANGADDADPTVDLSTGTEFYIDLDSDTYGNAATATRACVLPTGYSANADDCDDASAAVNPAATEVCNDIDDNCNGALDDADAGVAYASSDVWYADADTDTYGNASVTTQACDQPSGYVRDNTDCNDAASGVNPGASEVCDASDTDEDCDGLADDLDTSTLLSSKTRYYQDSDSDTYGDSASSQLKCEQPTGYVTNSTDCDDTRATVNPGATEVCDAADLDEDCDLLADDNDPSVSSATKLTWYRDADSDTYGTPLTTIQRCNLPSGYVSNDTDCNDGNATINPAATEVCDASDVDENCNGYADDLDTSLSLATRSTWYYDGDGDGVGSSTTTLACDVPTDYTSSTGDCDDGDEFAFPGNTEVCNDFVDNDCDPTTCLLASGNISIVADMTLTGESSSDFAGFRVALFPDLTGDTTADVVVSAYRASGVKNAGGATNTTAGIVYVTDSGAGMTSVPSTVSLGASSATIHGESGATRLGESIAAADFNNDGALDLLIGSVLADPNAVANGGRAYVVLGPFAAGDRILTATDQHNAEIDGSLEAEFLGWSVAAQDLTGDGRAEFAVASPQCNAASTIPTTTATTGAGLVNLFAGTTFVTFRTLDTTDASLVLTGTKWTGSAGGCAGYAILFADVDGTGAAELAVSEPTAGTGGNLYLVDTTQTGTVDLATQPSIDGPAAGSFMGSALASADFDGDGYEDLLVGASSYNTADGAAYILPGSASGIGSIGGGTSASAASIASFEPTAGSVSQFGISVASAGDLDQDGNIDVVIGAYSDDSVAANMGSAWVFHGPFTGTIVPNSTTDVYLTGATAQDQAGISVAGGQDVNDDGFDDIIIGAYGVDAGGTDKGVAYLLGGLGN